MRQTSTHQRRNGVAAMGAVLLTGTLLAGGYAYLIIEPVMTNTMVQIEREARHVLISLSDME